jgi:succinoglycan biosynthesis transport protein ExoP
MNRPGTAVTRAQDFGRLHPPVPVDPSVRGIASGVDAEVREYVHVLRRRSKWFLWTALLVIAAGATYLLVRTPTYRATALIEVRGGEDAPSVEGLFADGDPSAPYRRTRFGLLRSTTLAGRVIDELGLATNPEFNPDGETRPVLIELFLEALIVDPVESSNLVMVNFDASSPELAAQIANQVVRTYADMRVEGHEDAARRVADEVDTVQTRLAIAETELRSFAVEHDLPFLVEQDLTVQIGDRLDDLRERLAEAEGTRYESEAMYDAVVREGRSDLVESETLRTLEIRLADLRSEHARVTATFQDSYPEATELTRQIENVTQLIAAERSRLAARVESEYQVASEREALLAGAIDVQEQIANQLGPQTGQYHVLRQAVVANRMLYGSLLDRLREAETVAAIGPTDLAVVDAATPPIEPHSPVFAMTAALTLLLALLLGMGAAFGREIMEDPERTLEEFPISGDVPVLALIPAIGVEKGAVSPFPLPARRGLWSGGANGGGVGWHRIDKAHPTGRALADSFGTLRTAVLFRADEPVTRTILISSCRAGEGKTTVSVNLSMSLAQLGGPVLLIDADLRRPSVHRAFRVPAGPGLIQTLAEGRNWRDAVRPGLAPGLDVLCSGGATGRAADLLSSARVSQLLQEAQASYEYVIVDGPALFINASDALVLSHLVGGVVVVVRSRSTPKPLVDRIPSVVPNLIGVVVNDLRQESLPGYFEDYFDGYGEMREDGVSRDGEPSVVGATASRV